MKKNKAKNKAKNNAKSNNSGMTLPELVLAVLMLTMFTGVFILVTRFTAQFIQPLNIDGAKNFQLAEENPNEENELQDILNDHLKINNTIDSIIEIFSQPGTEKNFILNLKCTSLPYLDWNLPSIDENAIPKNYSICIKPTLLTESSYLNLNLMNGKPGIYIIYTKPNNGITYNSTPVRRIFCRPRPFCKS